MVSFRCGKEIEKDVFHLVMSMRAQNMKAWGSIPCGDSELFLCPTFITRQEVTC